MSTLYFAYGSNMVTAQMQERIASAQVYGVGSLKGWKVICNKRSKDGSGKANLVQAEGHLTWGVLYEIDEADLEKLDRIEGGYQRITVTIDTEQSIPTSAETYISEDVTDHPVAYDSYKALIIAGAEEHHLPRAYITSLQELPERPAEVSQEK